MSRSSEFSTKTRGQAFVRCQGRCEDCGANLKVGEGEYDHVIPVALGGESTLENCQVLCRPCHRAPGAKTAKDVKVIAKAKRVEARHVGIKQPAGTIKSPGFAKSAKPQKTSKWDFLPPLERQPMFRRET